MDEYNIVSWGNIVVVSAFALAWFIVGVLSGQQLSVSRANAPKKQKKRGSSGGKTEIYVGNLSYDVRDKDLRKTFEAFGSVVSARIIANKFNGKSKGFGFVEMSDHVEATAAIRTLNGKELRGRKAVVNEAKSQARD